MAQTKHESSIELGGVPGEQPATPDPTLIQLIASNAVLMEEHMPLALPFSFTNLSLFSLGLWGYL